MRPGHLKSRFRRSTERSGSSANQQPARFGRGSWRRLRVACALIPLAAASLPAPLSSQAGRAAAVAPTDIDAERLSNDLRVLAHDSMGGRATGTEGSRRARRYIESVFTAIGAEPIGPSFERPFRIARDGGPGQGINVVARIRGTERTERVIVITAHYDHLGERNGRIFNGADDNASGVAAMLALARAFAVSPPRHTIVFAALDAEELGLLGARAFVDEPVVPLDAIAINVNLDMVGRNAAGELWVAGTHHSPALKPFVEQLARDAPVRLRLGHDRPAVPGQDDWTGASDHAAFHARGIPFLYFGVEDHADYHRETDDFPAIEPGFQLRSARTIAAFVFALDDRLGTLLPPR